MKAFFEKLYDKSDNQFYREMKRNLQEETKMFIITANPEAFMYGEKDKQMKELLLEAGVIEKSKNFVDTFLEKHGSEPISSFSASSSKPTMPDDLTEDELQEVMRYIDFIRSKRK